MVAKPKARWHCNRGSSSALPYESYGCKMERKRGRKKKKEDGCKISAIIVPLYRYMYTYRSSYLCVRILSVYFMYPPFSLEAAALAEALARVRQQRHHHYRHCQHHRTIPNHPQTSLPSSTKVSKSYDGIHSTL